MLNKIQKNRKKISGLVAFFSLLIFLPIVFTTKSEAVMITLWPLIIVILILTSSMFFNGVVLTMKALTYLGCLIAVTVIGLILYLTVDFPDFVEKSSIITIIVVVINMFFTQGLRLPSKAGNWIVEKLDPSLLPVRQFGHGSDISLRPYSYLFGNRIDHIASGKPYALENSRGILRVLRGGLWLVMTISGFIGLFVVMEATTFAKSFGEFGVYLGIYVCFALIVLAFVLLMAGFMRLVLGIVISVVVFGVLYYAVIWMNILYVRSLILFWLLIVVGIGLLGFAFYRLIRSMEISMSRNLTLYDHEGKSIGFDLVASHEIPLDNFRHVALMTFDLPQSKVQQSILKLTDKMRFYANHRRILMAGYQADPSAQILMLYFYAESTEVLKKLSVYVSRWIRKPIKLTLHQDPKNALFTRDLVPEMDRLIDIMNQKELARLTSHRFNFDRLLRIVFYVKFENNDTLEEFRQVAEEMGYGSVTLYPDDKAAAIIKEVVLSLELMNSTCKKIHQLAKTNNGSFSGWSFEGDTR